MERAIHLDGGIPGNSGEFVKRVSSRAYDMRRNLQRSQDSSNYDGMYNNMLLNSFLLLCFYRL